MILGANLSEIPLHLPLQKGDIGFSTEPSVCINRLDTDFHRYGIDELAGSRIPDLRTGQASTGWIEA